ncbi:MAG: GNAT family N-acetyltransferase [Ktedonobacteraceae bacterium]|nr:GNAT family N-acetyltransferase [Ktedonobacteraceae bacterium]
MAIALMKLFRCQFCLYRYSFSHTSSIHYLDGLHIIIRPVRLEDAEALWTIARQEGVIETTMALPRLRLEQRRQSLNTLSENDHYVVAEKASQVAGLAGLTVGSGRLRHSGYVFIHVAAQYQGQQIGTRLLQTLLDLADQWLLLRRVELTVLTENEGACRLYERLGFVIEGCRKMSGIAQGEIKDEWLMARYK